MTTADAKHHPGFPYHAHRVPNPPTARRTHQHFSSSRTLTRQLGTRESALCLDIVLGFHYDLPKLRTSIAACAPPNTRTRTLRGGVNRRIRRGLELLAGLRLCRAWVRAGGIWISVIINYDASEVTWEYLGTDFVRFFEATFSEIAFLIMCYEGMLISSQ